MKASFVFIALIASAGIVLCIHEIDTMLPQPTLTPTPPPMLVQEMTARATDITGRLMACFGAPGAAQCRPVELQQSDHPEIIVRPVVVCFDGSCHLTREPIK